MQVNFQIIQVMQCMGFQTLHQMQKQLFTGILQNSCSEKLWKNPKTIAVVGKYAGNVADICSATLWNWMLFWKLSWKIYKTTLRGLIFAWTQFREAKEIVFREDLISQISYFKNFCEDLILQINIFSIFCKDLFLQVKFVQINFKFDFHKKKQKQP